MSKKLKWEIELSYSFDLKERLYNFTDEVGLKENLDHIIIGSIKSSKKDLRNEIQSIFSR